jgi:hypothetical protein
VFDRFTGHQIGTLWYYRALVEAFRARGSMVPATLIDELDRVVTDLEGTANGGIRPPFPIS